MLMRFRLVQRADQRAVPIITGIPVLMSLAFRERTDQLLLLDVARLPVDMSAIGTALAYLYTSLTAYKYLDQNPDIPEARWGKPVCLIGATTSIICFILLVFPSSPAAISVPSWIMLFIWVGLGGLFYLNRREELLNIPHSRLRYLLFGKSDYPVLFKDADEEPAPSASAE